MFNPCGKPPFRFALYVQSGCFIGRVYFYLTFAPFVSHFDQPIRLAAFRLFWGVLRIGWCGDIDSVCFDGLENKRRLTHPVEQVAKYSFRG